MEVRETTLHPKEGRETSPVRLDSSEQQNSIIEQGYWSTPNWSGQLVADKVRTSCVPLIDSANIEDLLIRCRSSFTRTNRQLLILPERRRRRRQTPSHAFSHTRRSSHRHFTLNVSDRAGNSALELHKFQHSLFQQIPEQPRSSPISKFSLQLYLSPPRSLFRRFLSFLTSKTNRSPFHIH